MAQSKQDCEYTPTANPAMAAGMRAIRSSGKAGPHQDGRYRRARTTQASLRRILREERGEQ